MSLLHDFDKVAKGWRWGRRRVVPRSAALQKREEREFPNEWARSPFAKAVRAGILQFGFKPLLHKEIDLEITGREVLDGLEMPVLFAANHSSHLDAPVLLTSLPPKWRHMTAVGAAADYFFDVWWRAIGSMLAFNTFPVVRGGIRKSARLGQRLLAEGWNIVVFPEGTRSQDGWMGDFKGGTAYLAIESRLPIVPIALIGTYQAMPKGRGWPVSGRPPVHVRFGRPLWPEEGERSRDLIARVRASLEALIDEDKTTWWESYNRALKGETPSGAGPDAAHWRRMWESSRPTSSHERKSVW